MSEVKVIDCGRGREKWCKHYAGMHEKTHCDAGVEYQSVRVDHDPIKYRASSGDTTTYERRTSYPCLPRFDVFGCQCEKREFRTRQEIEAEERENADRFRRIAKALESIHAVAKGRRGIGGDIECPNCKGTLRFSIASYNGHIHARCSTDGCMAFMQ